MSLIKNKSAFILLLGAGHGLNDMIAGFFLGNLVQVKSDLLQISMGLFLYNLLAFGGQYPVALLIEKMLSPKKFLLLAYSMNVVAVASFAFSPRLSIVLAGIASAIYHVAGGSICARDNKAVNIGLFAAPGVAGLIAGGYFAYEKFAIDGWLLIASIIILIMVSLCSFPGKKLSATPEEKTATGKKFHLEQHDLIMIMLLTFISLRSVIWDIFQLMHQNNYNWLLAIAGAAFVGKIAGGWLADKIGWRLYTLSSLFIATPLITFFKNELLLFCIGIGLLQSSIPATTSMLIHSLKGKTERAVGLSFGAAVMSGAIIFYTPFRVILLSNYFVWITAGSMLVLLFIYSKRRTSVISE